MGTGARVRQGAEAIGSRVQEAVTGIGPRHVIGFALAWLALSWLVFLGVDTWDWFGLHGEQAAGEPRPLLWLTIFDNGGPTEWLQWAALGAAGVVAAWIAGSLRGRGAGAGPKGAANAGAGGGAEARARARAGADARAEADTELRGFWLLMSVAFTMMLLEDAGELRQRVWEFANLFVQSPTVDAVLELAQFLVLASVPLYALWRFGPAVLRQPRVARHVAGGFIGYALAGGASATRGWGGDEPAVGWYVTAGEALHGLLGGTMSHPSWEQDVVYFLVIDRVFEESVELLGAAFFLSATIVAARAMSAAQAAGEAETRAA